MGHRSMHNLKDLARQGILPKSLSTCEVPICPYCQFGKAHKRTAEKGTIISTKVTKPGDLIHMDQAVSSVPGRMLTASGKPSKKECTVISFFIDSMSNKIYVEFQEGSTAKETISSKIRVERDAGTHYVKFKSFRADNGIYKSKAFHTHIEELGQTINFCAVGAHHQNGVAERSIRTIIERICFID